MNQSKTILPFALLISGFLPIAEVAAQQSANTQVAGEEDAGPVLPVSKAPLNYIGGRPMLRVTLRAGEKIYFCHLLVNLAQDTALILHPNAAGALRAEEVNLEAEGLTMDSLPVEVGEKAWMDDFTKTYAEALYEVPVAGMLGTKAFRDHTLVLDGPKQELRLNSKASASVKPEAMGDLHVLELAGDPDQDGLRIQVSLGNNGQANKNFILHTREPYSFVRTALGREFGDADGLISHAMLGDWNLASLTPLRPQGKGDFDGGIGALLLQQMVLTLAQEQGYLVLDHVEQQAYPKDEEAFYRASYGKGRVVKLQGFLKEYPESSFRLVAARQLFKRLMLDDLDQSKLRMAGIAALQACRSDKVGAEALAMLKELPKHENFLQLRKDLAEHALPQAQKDIDGNAPHKLLLELGSIAYQQEDLKEARRNLLNAVFGMPKDGPSNLALGRVYEDMDKLERARSRYMLAMLDAQKTGVAGLNAMTAVHARITDARNPDKLPDGEQRQEFLHYLIEATEGRVAALHPMLRPAADVKPTGRVVLVELFTGGG